MSDQSKQFKDVAERYLEYCQFERSNPHSPDTLRSHREAIGRLSKCFGQKDISEIAIEDIRNFRRTLDGRSLGYLQRNLSVLRSILKYAEDQGLSIMDVRKIELPKVKPREVEWLFEDELSRIMMAVDHKNIADLRFLALFTLLLDSGMRIKEALSLNRDSIDIHNHCVTIIGKGGKQRMVMCRDWSLVWIKKYLDMRLDTHPALFATLEDQRNHYEVDRLSRNRAEHCFQEIRERAGVPKLVPHICRKTFATWLNIKGIDIRILQLMLGHASVLITQRYVGTDWNHLRKVHAENVGYGAVELIGLEDRDRMLSAWGT